MRILLLLLVFLLAAFAGAQDVSYATWSAKLDPAEPRAGEAARVLIQVKTEPKWHIYGIEQPEGPISLSFALEGDALKTEGKPVSPRGKTEKDDNFGGIMLTTYEGEAVFSLPVRVSDSAQGSQKAKLTIRYQACTEGTCDLPKDVPIDLSFNVQEGPARAEYQSPNLEVPPQPAGYQGNGRDTGPAPPAAAPPQDDFGAQFQKAKDSGLIAFIWISFLLGFVALLTPCVFPMVPITVSFFSKSVDGERKTNYKGATAYCLGIIGTFTALGILVTVIFGASGIQQLATNPWVNMALVAIFVALALNLFGLFEIAVPSSVLTKLGGNAKRAGFVGPLLMGLTFTLTSFTCTVPIVGTLLAGAASGDLMYPILGMLAFSAAFASPFFLLALFPQAITKLPRSGMWMSSVKVFMGFMELAFALKFVSNVDLVWQLGWITKPIFLAIWAALFSIAALYLLGWLILPKETGAQVGWIRRGFGAAMAATAVFMLAGMEGFKLGELEAFLPPDPYPGRKATVEKGQVVWKDTFEEGLEAAKSEGRLMFINFTGVTCTNCRWMEKNMFTRADVAAEINKYVPIELFTDRSSAEDVANRDLQRKLSKVVTLPVYVLVDESQNPVRIFQGSTRNVEEFLDFLKGAERVAVR